MATPNYEIDPKDERLVDAKAEGNETLKEYETSMDAALSSNTNAMNDALDEIGEMGKDGKWTPGTPTASLMDAQNAQTEFAIQEIKQNKEQAKKDYIKEQSGAYTDWQKESSKHGVVAERLAENGMATTGYSESSQVRMYNQYQARITAARESFLRIDQDFDNAITSARLQNSSALAQIAADAMAQRLQIMLQFTMQNTELLVTKAQQKASIRQQNFSNYMAVYNQLMEENKLKETVRQHNETLAENKRQYNATLAENKRQHNEEMAFKQSQFAWQKEQAAKSSSGSSGGGGKIEKTPSSSGNKSSSSKKKNKIFVPVAFSGSTYGDAVSYMEKYGVPSSYASNVKTFNEWQRRRDGYDSYQQYLKDYTAYAVEELAK